MRPRRPAFASLSGANLQNRVQYTHRAGLRRPGWAWLAAAARIIVSGARLFIRPQLLRIQISGARVFAQPTGGETELATLVADQIVIGLGIATDESRLRIAAPVSGWTIPP